MKRRIGKKPSRSIQKLFRRPQIPIKKRTLFLSYAVTHGHGVIVSGPEVAGRTGFAQINSIGKLVSSWCRMSDSDRSSEMGESGVVDGSRASDSQMEDSQAGGEGTLVGVSTMACVGTESDFGVQTGWVGRSRAVYPSFVKTVPRGEAARDKEF